MFGTRDDKKRVPEEELADDMTIEPDEELGSVGALKEKLIKVREELAATKKEKQEYLDGWQRCKADTVNLRKDTEKDKERASHAATERLVEALLPALDSFDMAMNAPSWRDVDAAWRTGVEGIRNQLATALESVGVLPFGKEGDTYDAALHDIVQEIEAEGESGTVARVVRRGWKYQERILRPAHIILHKIES